MVTLKKAQNIRDNLKAIPLERLLLETDSPYLTPVPFRGKRNESSYLVHIAEKIAQIKGIALEEVASATTHNAFEMFGL
jgi:TatD DNase family protein